MKMKSLHQDLDRNSVSFLSCIEMHIIYTFPEMKPTLLKFLQLSAVLVVTSK